MENISNHEVDESQLGSVLCNSSQKSIRTFSQSKQLNKLFTNWLYHFLKINISLFNIKL